MLRRVDVSLAPHILWPD
ncbi:hypothetical protein ACLBW0_07955 [Enterobacteriaceae bacterium C34A]